MNHAYLLIGGNLGDRMTNLGKARTLIEQNGNRLVQCSAIYETAAWGMENQPSFYNQALHIETPLPSGELMQQLLNMEMQLGRVRQERMCPRIIDIDILLFNDAVEHTDLLTVPHPRLPQRRFALTPLAEIAGQLIHPVLQVSIQHLLDVCTDPLDVHKISGGM